MSNGLQSKKYTAWELLTAFWRSENKFFAYSLSIVLIAMTILLVGMDVIFTYWYNNFYNALQQYDSKGAISLLLVFMFIAAVFIIVSVYRYYVSQFFGLRWRKWMTEQFISRWLEKRSYYYLENFEVQTDNPDQRIQEDAGAIVNLTLDLVVGLIGAVTTFVAFIYVLWSLSGVIKIPLGHYTLVLPGYLVWVAIIYSLVGTYLTFKIGRPLVSLNFEQQRREATFRFAAMDLRTHSEDVALYRGEKDEKGILSRLFASVLDNWYMIIVRQKLLLWFTSGYGQMSVFLPLLVALPNYFNKVFQLGGLMQSLRAFASIQDALSYLVHSFTSIAQWRAVMKRLLTFLNHMAEVEARAEVQNQLRYKTAGQDKIVVRDLSINNPQGELLLTGLNEEFTSGGSYLLKGPSGIGKSTFIRVIAGIWPFGSGEVERPNQTEVMYLPQKPYVPIGSLRDALLFPSTDSNISDDEIKAALEDCRLPHFVNRLNESARWSELLSPGELQRINFARVLLHKPRWIFLDESTASLDVDNEKYLYNLLKSKLPDSTIISVGHRQTVEAFHSKIIDFSKYADNSANLNLSMS
ncbi:MAG TPA: ABC transporter ATP-binding protein/permease [Gammaproteobacteria bacterium]|nr:ABC transporter ATP-binding protein/permease [Gammaproteobacteria bacterium]